MPADTLSPRAAKAASTKAIPAADAAADARVDENLATLQQTGETIDHASAECRNIISDNIAAAVETGTLTSQLIAAFGKSYVEAYNTSMHTISEISRDAAACRTPADFAELQKRSMALFTGSFNANSKRCSDMFGIYTKALEPLVARAAFAPERLFKAVAD